MANFGCLQFSNIFLPKWCELIQDGQFCLFCNISNIFLPKWSKFILNGQFWLFCNFPNIFLIKVVQIDSEWPIWPFGIFSNRFALKCSEIVWYCHKVLRTYNFHFTCSFPGNIIPYGSWGTAVAHLQKYIGGWLRFHYNSSGFNLAGCLHCW